jgi:predicted RNase H-like nuclease (RuvC/YqgF family)
MQRDHGQFLVELQDLCQAIAQGRYDGLDHLFALTGDAAAPEEIRDLAEAFGSMVVQIEAREFRLGDTLAALKESNRKLEEAQKRLATENMTLRGEVHRLKIEIDQSRKEEEVAEIADTEYFQTLQSRARTMRARHKTRD